MTSGTKGSDQGQTGVKPGSDHGLTPGLFGWWRDGTPAGRRALIAAGLGWMLDSFDVMLYALTLAAVMPALGLSKETAGLL